MDQANHQNDNIKENARLSETHNRVILAIEEEMKKYQ